MRTKPEVEVRKSVVCEKFWGPGDTYKVVEVQVFAIPEKTPVVVTVRPISQKEYDSSSRPKPSNAPWHGPSECSFKYGFRIGVMKGKVLALKKMLATASHGFGDSQSIQRELQRANRTLREWQKTRP